jgi:cell wall-associated NlpC family hydrolase
MIHVKKSLISIIVFVLSLYFLTSFVFAEENSLGKVTASVLNLRSGPALTYDVVGSLFQNKHITILSSTNNWYKVKTSSGKVGWVIKDYISAVPITISRGNDISRSAAVAPSISSEIVDFAKNYLGVNYVWGGKTPDCFDCSVFVLFIYNHYGIQLTRVACNQATQGTYVAKSDLIPGDLVFFDTDGGHQFINHVGMYIGNDQFIQASSGHGDVVISDIAHGFYANTYMTARRFLK